MLFNFKSEQLISAEKCNLVQNSKMEKWWTDTAQAKLSSDRQNQCWKLALTCWPMCNGGSRAGARGAWLPLILGKKKLQTEEKPVWRLWFSFWRNNLSLNIDNNPFDRRFWQEYLNENLQDKCFFYLFFPFKMHK